MGTPLPSRSPQWTRRSPALPRRRGFFMLDMRIAVSGKLLDGGAKRVNHAEDATAKRAPAEASALSQTAIECALVATAFLLLCAYVSGGVPHAASFVATSFVGCLRHVSGKGWAGEGEY